MVETVAIIFLAAALYLLIRRLPASIEVMSQERQRERVSSKIERRARVEAILDEVAPVSEVSEASVVNSQSSIEPVVTAVVEPKYAPEVDQLLREADQAFESGALDEAERTYIRICAIEPHIGHVYNRLGAIYLKRDNLEDAKEALEAGSKIDPLNGQILNNLGLVFFKQSKFHDAVRQYERSIRAERGIAQRHLNLGLAYMALRQYNKAAHQFNRASNIEPDNDEYKRLVVEAQSKHTESRVGIVSR